MTYSIHRDGIAPLALPNELDEALLDALYVDNRHEVAEAIDAQVNANLATYGETAEGEWLGDWSAEAIVRDALAVAE